MAALTASASVAAIAQTLWPIPASSSLRSRPIKASSSTTSTRSAFIGLAVHTPGWDATRILKRQLATPPTAYVKIAQALYGKAGPVQKSSLSRQIYSADLIALILHMGSAAGAAKVFREGN